jgi:hypothetical protein
MPGVRGGVTSMNPEMSLKSSAKRQEVSRQRGQAVGVIFYLGESDPPGQINVFWRSKPASSASHCNKYK